MLANQLRHGTAVLAWPYRLGQACRYLHSVPFLLSLSCVEDAPHWGGRIADKAWYWTFLAQIRREHGVRGRSALGVAPAFYGARARCLFCRWDGCNSVSHATNIFRTHYQPSHLHVSPASANCCLSNRHLLF